MSETNVTARIMNIGSTLENLTKLNPILKKNEICIVEIPNDSTSESIYKIKVGDGENHFVDLPYISGASDLSEVDFKKLNDKVNSLQSTSLKRKILTLQELAELTEYGDITSEAFLSTAETNTIYMVPSSEDPMNCTYKEYLVLKDIPSIDDSGTDYMYIKAEGWVPENGDEPPESVWPLYSFYLRDAIIKNVEGYDEDSGRPIYRVVTFSGYNPVYESNEERTITVSYWDTGDLWGSCMSVLYGLESHKFNLGYANIEFESVPEDNQMYSLGYNVRGRFSYEVTSLKNRVELIGSTDIDITNYYNKSETESLVDTAVNARITSRIDTTYKSTSANAQSGTAVRQAISNAISPINTKVNSLTSSSLSRTTAETLPEIESISKLNIIYMVKNNSTENNVYDEYLPTLIPQEPIAFNNVPVEAILNTGDGSDIGYDATLNMENISYTLEPSSETSLWLYCSDINRIIILNTANLSDEIVNTLNDIMSWSGNYSKYPTVSFSNYNDGQLGSLSFNVNTLAYEMIGSSAVDLTNYQTKIAQVNTINDADTELVIFRDPDGISIGTTGHYISLDCTLACNDSSGVTNFAINGGKADIIITPEDSDLTAAANVDYVNNHTNNKQDKIFNLNQDETIYILGEINSQIDYTTVYENGNPTGEMFDKYELFEYAGKVVALDRDNEIVYNITTESVVGFYSDTGKKCLIFDIATPPSDYTDAIANVEYVNTAIAKLESTIDSLVERINALESAQ